MDDPIRREVAAWFAKALRDLESAERLVAGQPPFRDTAAYHCQQAAEKALKAFLTAAAIPFPKTHDLTALITLARETSPGLSSLDEAAITLTPYATLFRYPDAVMEPDDVDIADAIRLARETVTMLVKAVQQLPMS